MAMRASLAMVAGTGGGGAPIPPRRSEPGSAMDPAHTFRTLVIDMLRGDPSARSRAGFRRPEQGQHEPIAAASILPAGTLQNG